MASVQGGMALAGVVTCVARRFECAIEASWKAAQAVLSAVEGLTATSPKIAIRASHGIRWIDAQTTDALLVAIDDSNLTSRT